MEYNYEDLGGGIKKNMWNVFKHNGPYFPPKYESHGINVLINNKETKLPLLAEEYATLYARYLGTQYIENPLFNKNFWKDFKVILPKELNVDNLEDIDFSPIKKYLENEKEKRKDMSKEEKLRINEQQKEIEEPYTYCFIDGGKQKVGNYRIEPPGIFMGRGTHPKIGSIKPRLRPEDVTINIDKESKIPKPNVDGNWGKVIHDKTVVWLATWKDHVTGKNKYIFTSVESMFKSKSDEKKFDLAKRLKRKARTIREEYESHLKDTDMKKKQLATALYFVDNFALRVGGKKNTKEKADTVGVTSLRVEHLNLIPPNILKLDFLGKDSIRYCKKTPVITDVYENLELLIRGKDKKEQLFNLINSSALNDYLDSFMKDLTAKVFRTYNASNLFQKELDKIKEEKINKIDESERLNYLISLFNQANTEVALLCNHQKAVSGNLDEQLKKFDDKIKKYKKIKKKLLDLYTTKKTNEDKRKVREKIDKADAKIKLLKLKKDTKSKMKNVSLGTSKNNYIDPRIVFAFIKRFNISEENQEKIMPKKLIERFEWASSVDKNYRF